MEPGPDWKLPLPERLARPTYSPAVLALAAALALLGPVTDMAISVISFGLGAVALIGWISEIEHDGRNGT
jgi:hypothetical protein